MKLRDGLFFEQLDLHIINTIQKRIGDRKMDGTVRNNIKIGAKVLVIQKQDQRTGKLTEGVVQKLLTKSANHPRGIKVMLEGGIVGRVDKICE